MEGKFDLPMGIGHLIGGLLRKQYFPHYMFSVKRDGTVVVSFENEEEVSKHQSLVLIIMPLGLKITYKQIDCKVETTVKKCRYCSSDYQKSTYRCTFEIEEILHNYTDVTQAYMKGGERTETVKLELARKIHKKRKEPIIDYIT